MKTDFKNARGVWNYDTNLESVEPWMDDGGTKDESLHHLQKYTSANIQKGTVSQTDHNHQLCLSIAHLGVTPSFIICYENLVKLSKRLLLFYMWII